MRTFFRLLTLLLCVELIVSPINPSLSLLSQTALANSCPAGLRFDSVLNRCLTTDEATKVMNATASCSAGDKECYKNNAKQAFTDAGGPAGVENKKFMSTVAGIAAVAGPVTIAAAGLSNLKSKCASYSFYAMIGGAAALIIGDNLANFQHAKRLKQIKEDWGKVVNPEQANGDKDKEREISIEAQSEAFEMLARAEDSLATAAKLKQKFFMVASLAYVASGVLSAMEMIKQKTLDAGQPTTTAEAVRHRIANFCAPAAASNDTSERKSLYSYYVNPTGLSIKEELQYQYNLRKADNLAAFYSIQEFQAGRTIHGKEYTDLRASLREVEPQDKSIFELLKESTLMVLGNLSPIQVAHAEEKKGEVNTNAAKAYKEVEAQGINWAGLAIGAAAGFAAGKLVGSKMITPKTRLIFSGVMAGMTMMMAKHAGSQAEASTKRAEFLRKLKSEFQTASGAVYACKSEDRNDPGKPNCYCYTSENQRNTNRGNSQVCQQLWAGVNTKATNYSSLGSTGSSKVCITNNNQADKTCACRTTNTCMKVNLGNLKGLGAGSMSVMTNAIQPLNKVADGSVDAANLDGASLANQAARVAAIQKKLEDTKELADLKKNKGKEEASLRAELDKAASSNLGGGQGLLGSNTSSNMPSNPGEAARMLDKELEASGVTGVGGDGNTLAAPTNDASSEPEMEFGLSNDQANSQETQIAELMKEELDYGSGSDTNNDAKANIFEVLSNRYQRSGMKRLFADEPTADAKAKEVPTKK